MKILGFYNNTKIRTEREYFLDWREKTIQKYNNICAGLNQHRIRERKIELHNLMNLKKCMVKLSWEFCSCNPYCSKFLISSLDFKSSCNIFIKDNTDLDQENINCEFLRIKRFDSQINIPNQFNNGLTVKKNIFSELSVVCQIYQSYKEVDVCVDNFFYDPGLMYDDQAYKFFDLEFKGSNRCEKLKFNEEQLKMTQIISYLPSNVIVHIRNKRDSKCNEISYVDNDFFLNTNITEKELDKNQFKFCNICKLLCGIFLILTLCFIIFNYKNREKYEARSLLILSGIAILIILYFIIIL